MTSPVDLCNSALDQISARTAITGINPASPPNNLAAQVASRTYQTQADAVFRAAHWNAARIQKTLTLLKAAPGTPQNPNGTLPIPLAPYLYEYAWPVDCLQFRFIIPMSNVVAGSTAPLMTNTGLQNQPLMRSAMPFLIGIDTDADGNQIKVICSDAPNAQGVYTGRINNVDLWDASLQNAVIGALAAWFVMPISGDKTLMTMRTQLAVGLFNAARMSDGNEGTTSADVIPDWMQIRDTGSGWGFFGSNGYSGGLYGAGCIGAWSSWGGPDGNAY